MKKSMEKKLKDRARLDPSAEGATFDYLASPFAHREHAVRSARANVSCIFLALETQKRKEDSEKKNIPITPIFSPLAHTKTATEEIQVFSWNEEKKQGKYACAEMQTNWEEMEKLWLPCVLGIARVSANTGGFLLELRLPGWKKSEGLAKEKKLFALNKIISYEHDEILDLLSDHLKSKPMGASHFESLKFWLDFSDA